MCDKLVQSQRRFLGGRGNVEKLQFLLLEWRWKSLPSATDPQPA